MTETESGSESNSVFVKFIFWSQVGWGCWCSTGLNQYKVHCWMIWLTNISTWLDISNQSINILRDRMSKILFSVLLAIFQILFCTFDISESRIRNNYDQFLLCRLVPAWESSCSQIIELRTQWGHNEDTIVRIETVIKGQGLSLGWLIMHRINSSLTRPTTVNGGMEGPERDYLYN